MRAASIAVFVTLISLTAIPAQSSQTGRLPESPQDAAVSRMFEDRVNTYGELRKKLEGDLPRLKSTNDAAEITAHQQLLSAKLVEARKNAQRGDIFAPQVEARFREIIRTAFQEPGGETVRQTVTEGDVPKPIVPKVNAAYPSDSPVQTTPPTLLKRLPALPMELAYRISGRNFILLDNKTNLIVDFIPNAVP